MNIREPFWLVLPQSLLGCLAQLSAWLAAAVTAVGHSQDEPRQLVDLFSTSSPARLQRSDSRPKDSLTRCWFWQKSQFQVFPSLPFPYIYSYRGLPSNCFLPSAAPRLWACFVNWITEPIRIKTVPSPSRELFLRDKVRLPLQRDGAALAAPQKAQGGLRALFPPFELPRSPKSLLWGTKWCLHHMMWILCTIQPRQKYHLLLPSWGETYYKCLSCLNPQSAHDPTLTSELLRNAKLMRSSPQQSMAEPLSGSQTGLWKQLTSSWQRAILKV